MSGITRAHPPEGRGLIIFAGAWVLAFGAWPLLRLAAEAVGRWDVLWALAGDPAVWRAALRSLGASAAAAALATLLGGAAALLLLLRLRFRRTLALLFVLPLLIPPQVMALAWIQAAAPSGPFRLWMGLPGGFGQGNWLYGPHGIVLLLAVQTAPLVFLATTALARRLPGELVDAARGLGASPLRALFAAALPLLAPGIAAGGALAFVAAIGNFGTAALIGLPARWPMLTVLIWQRLTGPGADALAEAAALSLLLAGLAGAGLALVALARRGGAKMPAGRAFVPVEARLPAAFASLGLGAYAAIVLGLPLAALIAAAFAPAIGLPPDFTFHSLAALAGELWRQPAVGEAVRNSLLLALAAGTILAVVAVPLARLSARPRARALSVWIGLSYALPGTITAVGAILVALMLPFGAGAALYGGTALILLAYLSRFALLAVRPVAASLSQLDPRIADAGAGLGAGPWARLRRITLPLVLPAIAAGGTLVALSAVNELTVSALLYAAGSRTLGVVVFGLQEGGESRLAAAVSLLALGITAGLMAVAGWLSRRCRTTPSPGGSEDARGHLDRVSAPHCPPRSRAK